jgi:hypothetical protein
MTEKKVVGRTLFNPSWRRPTLSRMLGYVNQKQRRQGFDGTNLGRQGVWIGEARTYDTVLHQSCLFSDLQHPILSLVFMFYGNSSFLR